MLTRGTFALLWLFLVVSCLPMGGPTELKWKSSDMTDSSSAPIANRTASLAAFKQTVYPIVSANCVGCHSSSTRGQSPVFADVNPDKAFDALTSSRKVDLVTPKNSRIVNKPLYESHNCWTSDCAADSAEMLAAVNKWVALAPASGEASVATGTLTMPPENTAVLAQTEWGTLLLDAEQNAYSSEVVSGRFTEKQDSAAISGRYLSFPKIEPNTATTANRTLGIDANRFNACKEFDAADLAAATRAIRINQQQVHIPSGLTTTAGRVVNDGYRPYSVSIAYNIVRPDKRIEYAKMLYSGNLANVQNMLLFNGGPTDVTKSQGSPLPATFQGGLLLMKPSLRILPHFTQYSDVFNANGTYKTSGSFVRDDGNTYPLYKLFEGGAYSPTDIQLHMNFIAKGGVYKRDQIYAHLKQTIQDFFYSDPATATARPIPTHPYSQIAGMDVKTYFTQNVQVTAQCPAGVNCTGRPDLLKYQVTGETGVLLTQANALDCYTLNAGQTDIVYAGNNALCNGDPKYFHLIDVFAHPVIDEPNNTSPFTQTYRVSTNSGSYNEDGTASPPVLETFNTDGTRNQSVNSMNNNTQELDPDALFTGGASVVTDEDNQTNFNSTLYATLKTTRCVDCHGDSGNAMAPQFVSPNPATALSVIKAGDYVNFGNPAASFRPGVMVHNCDPNSADPRYSCTTAAENALKTKLITAITNWKTANEATAAQSGAQVYRVLTNNERLPGRGKYKFKVTEAGKYNVWMKLKEFGNNTTRLNFRILNSSGNAVSYSIGSNANAAGTCYQWQPMTAQDIWSWSTPGRNSELSAVDARGYRLLDLNKQPLPLPNNRVYFDLAPGDYTLDVIGLAEDMKLDAVGVNKVPSMSADDMLLFQPDRRAVDEKNIADYRRKVLRYDLTSALGLPEGKSATFEVEVKKEFTNQNYVFRNPRFITSPRDFNLHVKGIKVYINGKWSSPDATYNALEAVTGDNKVLTYAPLVALVSGADDLIHFQFDELSVSTEALTPIYPKGSLPAPITDRRCNELDYFVKNVKPILFSAKVFLKNDQRQLNEYINTYPGGPRNGPGRPTQYNCVSCHNATHPYFKMSTFLNDEEFCREALSRVDFEIFGQSVIVRGINGEGNHPKFVFLEKFVNGADDNFKVHDNGQDYVLGRYKNPLGIASEYYPGPFQIWTKAAMGIAGTTFSTLSAADKSKIMKNGLFRTATPRKINLAVQQYSWYSVETDFVKIFDINTSKPDNNLGAYDVIDPDPLKGRIETRRDMAPVIYDVDTYDGSGIPYAIDFADNSRMLAMKANQSKQYIANGPLGFDRASVDYISTTPGMESQQQMWDDYETLRVYYREKVIQWIRLENAARAN